MHDEPRLNPRLFRAGRWCVACCALALAFVLSPQDAEAGCGNYVHVRHAWADAVLAGASHDAGFDRPLDAPTPDSERPCRGLDCRPSSPKTPALPTVVSPAPRNESCLAPRAWHGDPARRLAAAHIASSCRPASPAPARLLRPPRPGQA